MVRVESTGKVRQGQGSSLQVRSDKVRIVYR